MGPTGGFVPGALLLPIAIPLSAMPPWAACRWLDPLRLSPAMARSAASFGWLTEKIKIPISQKTANRGHEKKLDKSRW